MFWFIVNISKNSITILQSIWTYRYNKCIRLSFRLFLKRWRIRRRMKLSANKELKVKFKNGYQEFWLQKQILPLYPWLWDVESVLYFWLTFPSSHSVDCGFTEATCLLAKKRNRLQVADHRDIKDTVDSIRAGAGLSPSALKKF